jgi:hypothetical protein
MGARLSCAERALLLLGLLLPQNLVLGCLLLPAALLLVWLYFWLGNVAAGAFQRVERTPDASRAVRRLEAKLQDRAARKAVSRRRREEVDVYTWQELLVGLLAGAVAAGIGACVLIVAKAILFLVVAGMTMWLYSVLGCCCAACMRPEHGQSGVCDGTGQGESRPQASTARGQQQRQRQRERQRERQRRRRRQGQRQR